tara:strand:- start:2740 stop:3000 length:261 start_codon:yes stop_codon:yes gene_type:complete
MEISVELTFTPLQDNFEEPIINFIKKLRQSDLQVLENPLSTQVYGGYKEVMHLLHTEIEDALQLVENGLMTIKIVKSNRGDYKPFF